MSWTIDVVHFFIAYGEGWWFFSLYYIIIKSIWNYAYYIASSSPFIALLISPNFSLIWFIYFIPTVHKNFIREKILWNAQIDQRKKKKFNFFFIFLIFIAWKQIIMHMLPSFCTQHIFLTPVICSCPRRWISTCRCFDRRRPKRQKQDVAPAFEPC